MLSAGQAGDELPLDRGLSRAQLSEGRAGHGSADVHALSAGRCSDGNSVPSTGYREHEPKVRGGYRKERVRSPHVREGCEGLDQSAPPCLASSQA